MIDVEKINDRKVLTKLRESIDNKISKIDSQDRAKKNKLSSFSLVKEIRLLAQQINGRCEFDVTVPSKKALEFRVSLIVDSYDQGSEIAVDYVELKGDYYPAVEENKIQGGNHPVIKQRIKDIRIIQKQIREKVLKTAKEFGISEGDVWDIVNL
jgi:hypothetical protein